VGELVRIKSLSQRLNMPGLFKHGLLNTTDAILRGRSGDLQLLPQFSSGRLNLVEQFPSGCLKLLQLVPPTLRTAALALTCSIGLPSHAPG